MPKHVHTLDTPGVTWVDITKVSDTALADVRERFNLLGEDIKDCLPPLQRPKIIKRQNYIFMILLFPIFDRKTREIDSAEVDFFIGKDFIVTVHNNLLTPIRELHTSCRENEEARNYCLGGTAGRAMAEILGRLLHYCYPILIHIGQDIDSIEKRVFEVNNQKVTFEIMRLKTNTVEFKSNTALHRSIINKLIKLVPEFFGNERLGESLNNILEDTKDIRESLESYLEAISAIDDTHQSLINLRANQIMKNLQIFAVIVFPLTLLAAIFGMNTLGGMPFFDHPYGFWMIAGIMLSGTFAMLLYFKWRKWY